MGPHHAQVLGWAKSFTKALDQSLIQSVVPHDVLDCVDDNLARLELPHLATHNIDEGKSQYMLLYI